VAAAVPIAFDSSLRARMAENLARHARHRIDLGDARAAAVALTLLPNAEGQACFLLTRRAVTLARHRGQFALPGGRLDPGEGEVEAALRELSEELGVTLGAGQVLGQLDDFKTRSGFVITPVVLWSEVALELSPNPAEVARVYRVPLDELYGPAVPCLSPAQDGASILSLPLVGTHVFSPTAAIIYQLREVAIEGRATRVHHYEQPLFAWK
jgi:8-oxo-dGTP pyrophosphatase MutT (NUDIX family)